MIEANARIHPPLLAPEEMAELLAALVAESGQVAALVASLAPRNAGAMLEELEALAYLFLAAWYWPPRPERSGRAERARG